MVVGLRYSSKHCVSLQTSFGSGFSGLDGGYAGDGWFGLNGVRLFLLLGLEVEFVDVVNVFVNEVLLLAHTLQNVGPSYMRCSCLRIVPRMPAQVHFVAA